MKELKIETQPNPLKQFDNIKYLKKLVKPIKTDRKGNFIEKLFTQSSLLNTYIGKNFSLYEHKFINLKCNLIYNIPIITSALINENGSNSYISEIVENDECSVMFENKKELSDFLHNLEYLPEKIIPIRLEFEQKILKTKSQFIYEFDVE